MTTYDNVKRIADSQKKTISKIESEAGIANGTIGGWKKSKPYAATLLKVAKALGVSIEELMA